MPDYIRKHIQKNDSINFQVIGARGKGKSTMVRHLLEIENKADDGNKNLPETGSSDTTRKPTPYNFRGIYLWDMPGLGGLITHNKIWKNLIFRDRNFRIVLGRLFEKIWNGTF